MAPLPLPSFISPLVLPTPPEKYSAQDQREFRRAIERAFLTINTAGFSGTSMWFDVTSSSFAADRFGAVNAAPSFQAAIDAAAVTGGIVYIPHGNYTLTSQIVGAENVVMRGDGAGSILNAVGLGGKAIIAVGGKNAFLCEDFAITGECGTGIEVDHCTNVILRRLNISGATSPSPTTGYAAGIHVFGNSDLIIEECALSGNGLRSETTASYDILINGLDAFGYPRHYIQNNRCSSTNVFCHIAGFNLQESDISRNNVAGAYTRPIAGNGGYGILLYKSGYVPWSGATAYVVGDVVAVGEDSYICILNHTNHTPPNAIYWTLLDASVRDNSVTNNTVHNTEGSGIYCAAAKRTLVANNHVTDVATVESEAGLPVAGISINAGGAQIIGNHVLRSGRSGISLSGLLTEIGTCVIGNTVTSSAGNAGIRIGFVTGVRVADNIVTLSAGQGIGSNDATWTMTGVAFENNYIADSGGSGMLITVPKNCAVETNTVLRSGNHGINLSINGYDNTMSGNIVVDSGQTTPLTYSNIVIDSPRASVCGNVTGNTLADGASIGIVVDAAGAPGTVALGNTGYNNRTQDFSFAAGTVTGGNRDTANVGQFTLGSVAMLEGSGGAICQLLFGSSPETHSIGKQYSTSDALSASNAQQVAGDLWHQNIAGSLSTLERRTMATGNVEWYVAPAGAADGTFATFWGTAVLVLSPTGAILTVASTTAGARLRLPHGAAPSSPVNGDVWTTTAGLFVRINGATVGPLS